MKYTYDLETDVYNMAMEKLASIEKDAGVKEMLWGVTNGVKNIAGGATGLAGHSLIGLATKLPKKIGMPMVGIGEKMFSKGNKWMADSTRYIRHNRDATIGNTFLQGLIDYHVPDAYQQALKGSGIMEFTPVQNRLPRPMAWVQNK